MCFRDQKNATKDLDLVFSSAKSYHEFVRALRELGFKEPPRLERAYEKMEAASIWQDESGFRFDLFVKTVCNALSMSKGMRKRSELLGEFGRLEVRIVSNEDVILFKSVTERPGDADDIAAIARRARIDWRTVLNECIRQSRKRAWYGALCNKLEELKARHGIDIPIRRELERLYKQWLVKKAYENHLKKGLSKKQALAELKKRGFTEKELSQL